MLRAVGRIVGAVVSKLLGAVGTVQPTVKPCVAEASMSAARLLPLALRKRQEAFTCGKFNLRVQLLHTLLIRSLRQQLMNRYSSATRKRSAYELSGGIGLMGIDEVAATGRMVRTRNRSDEYEPPFKRARYTGHNGFSFYAYCHGIRRPLNSGLFSYV